MFQKWYSPESLTACPWKKSWWQRKVSWGPGHFSGAWAAEKSFFQASSLLPGPSLPREQLLPSVLVPELDLAFGQRQERPAPPRWLAEFLSNLFTTVGPRGLEFAMASIDRAVLRNLVCLEVGVFCWCFPTQGCMLSFEWYTCMSLNGST